jgi:hypothetical protein
LNSVFAATKQQTDEVRNDGKSFKQLKNFTKILGKILRQKGNFLGLFEALNNPKLGSF